MSPTDGPARGRVRHRATAKAALVANACAMTVGMAAFAVDGRGAATLPAEIVRNVYGGLAASTSGIVFALTAGIAVHAVLALLFGFIFAIVVNLVTHEFEITGAAYGVVLWMLDTEVASLSPALRGALAAAPPSISLFCHVVFGVALGWLARRNVVRIAR